MKKYKSRNKTTRKCVCTPWQMVFDEAVRDCMFCEWVNYPHRNARVAQIAFIQNGQRLGVKNITCVMRKNRIYIVRKEVVSIFRSQH